MNPKYCLHVYYGEGKGKTSAAVGTAVRARGAGWKVLMAQFLKSTTSGEREGLQSLGIPVRFQPGCEKFLPYMSEREREVCIRGQRELWRETAAQLSQWDMVVFDELLGALETGILTLDEVLPALREKPCELVVTGRRAPGALLEAADYVSRIGQEKHPFENGLAARKGIEF